MKIKQIIIQDFRSYEGEHRIDVDDLTIFIGRNDAGKSTILEALEVFFNNKVIKIDKDDSCTKTDSPIVHIGCVFADLPAEIVLDANATTTLANEYLLNQNGDLEIHKIYDCSVGTIKPKAIAIAHHPTVNSADSLLTKKNADLKKALDQFGVDKGTVDQRINPDMRRAIWGAIGNLELDEVEIPLDKEDAKAIWGNIQSYLPVFALFRSDRPSTDEDSEVQDPMKLAVKEAIASVNAELEQVKQMVQERATDVARRTLEKLNEMAPALANELNPNFKAEPNWDSIFKLKLTGDDDIPINKRGSGVRRLILLNFFRAEAERRQAEAKSPGVIYAIEEPETSQHPANQRMLVSALQELSEQNGCQVFVTTHVPELAGTLPLSSLRYVETIGADGDRVKCGSDEVFRKIADDLGVLPSKEVDDKIQVLVCVEGPHDVSFLKILSGILSAANDQIIDLGNDSRIAIMPLGGGTLKQWVDEHYLKGLGIPEVHIYDRDEQNPPKYQGVCDQVNARGDKSWATLTNKREMENYIHPQVINDHFQINIMIEDMTDVPDLVAVTVSQTHDHPLGLMSERRAKKVINNEVVLQMTPDLLTESDPDNEIIGWLSEISQRLK